VEKKTGQKGRGGGGGKRVKFRKGVTDSNTEMPGNA